MEQKYYFDDQKDELIRAAYSSPNICRKRGASPLNGLIKRFGIPRQIIYRRALRLGVIPPQMRKEPNWTAHEDEILERNSHSHPEVIARILKRNGYSRTPTAIALRQTKRHGGRTEMRSDRGLLKLNEACRLLGCEYRKLKRFIDAGTLKAVQDAYGARADGRTTAWIVKEKDLRELLIRYTAEFNFSRIDKFWLVDLLTGNSIEKGDRDA